MNMKNICIALIYSCILTFNMSCTKKNKSNERNTSFATIKQKSDCDKILYQFFYTSDFEKKEKYEVRIDEIRNDTIIIKAFTRNNLSDNPQIKQIVESVVGWFIIPPKRDALYLSLNALDPIEPNFKKIKTKEKYFKDFLNCINQKKTNEMKNETSFTDLFNEGTNIEFTPNDLNKNNPDILEFKEKLSLFENQHPLPEDFETENLSYLINNETFFDSQYYTNSNWLQYFITKYKIEISKLNTLMEQAIRQEDFDAVKILLTNEYIVSEKEITIASETKKDSYEKIDEDKKEGYESYLISSSKIDEIKDLLKAKFNSNKISDPDGFTNLRKDKTSSSEILQKVNSGEFVEVLDNSEDWSLVKTKEGKQGYVHKSRIKSN